jgi:adenylate kinase
MALNLVMLGPPGVGKGTQAEIVARDHAIPKISTGDMLREAVHARTELGRAAKAYLDAGDLVSDDLIIGIVRERLARADARQGFVLDGFPRTVPQAVALDEMLADRDPLIIVEIAAPEAVLVQRLLARRVCSECGTNARPDDVLSVLCARCGGKLVQRSDDNETVVRARLATYARQTRPLVEYYRDRPTFRVIDGNQPPAVVTAEIRAAVASVVASRRTQGRPSGSRS